jgi:SAM-dependent methyltransferase
MFLSEVISPVYISKARLKKIIRDLEANDKIGLNIGSGVTNYSQNIINFDLQPFKNVAVLGDLFHLPFKDNSFDYVFSIYVLEHIPDTKRAINEMLRVLKPGGTSYCLVPFIQGFHAAPADFTRLTISGVKEQFSDFARTEAVGLGPTSALLWIFQEWLALVLSLGIKRVGAILHILFMVLSFPIKYLDVLLSHFSGAEKIAVATEVIAYKGK